MRCPQCNRVLQDTTCSVHGDVTGVPDLRIKLIIDDGTGAVHGILGRELTEKLLGKTMDKWQQSTGKDHEADPVIHEIYNTLFSHRLRLQGNALGDQFGTTIIARDAQIVDYDITSIAEHITADLEDFP